MRNSKRGSSSVFILMILATLMTITMAFMAEARNEYAYSRIDLAADMSGDSVLSEYDRYVQEEYGLFLLGGTRPYLTGRFRSYMDHCLGGMRGVRIKDATVSGEGRCAADTELIREQIVEQMKYEKVMDIVSDKHRGSKNDMEYEILRNRKVLVSLPTHGMPKPSLTSVAKSMAEDFEGLKDIFKEGTDKYLMDEYILNHFNTCTMKIKDDHFFRNEVEYILGGEASDRKNEKRVELAIQALRFPLNLKYLYTDKEKMEALLAAAELLTPEAAPLTQMALASTWAYAESDNDVKLLWEGRKVPIMKDKSSWAVDLDGAIEGIKGGTFYPEKETGYDYEDHLRFLLFFQDETLKTARIMDLIQINTRMNSDSTFVIQEHCTGIHVSLRSGRRNFIYEKKY